MACNPMRKVVCHGRVFMAYAVKKIIRRTGKARRHWAEYLAGKILNGARLEIFVRLLTPAEIRAYVGQLPDGWSAVQAMWERLLDRLGVTPALAFGDGLARNVLVLMG